ncbi:pilus assembly protein PilW [Acinetobacter sp. AM]|uniref:PilW family protein n=1 Tax=Acinetobacter sp. AM TaxID=2170730 RepID=UPI000DE5D95C|nr:PilW family protein [Acinetobacter sp. AM]PWB14627.1 pilus assembly protein PilW [Acinetobacter sp. AM]
MNNSYVSMTKQQGFTLVELMVALVLGLLISAAAIQLFTGGLLSSRMQEASAELQNSGVFGLDYIAKDIRLANYANTTNPELNEQTSWGGIVLTARTATVTTANIPIPASAPFVSNGLLSHSQGDTLSTVTNEWRGLSNVNLTSDQLTIQFISPNAMMNCEGASVQAGDYVIQRYFVRRDPATATSGTDYGLACDANQPTAAGTAPVLPPTAINGFGDAGEIIIPRVDHFTVQLGVRNGSGSLAYYTINQYRTLATTERAASRIPPRIIAVKLGVLVRSMDNTNNAAIDLTKQIPILNQNVTLNNTTTKFARRVYTTNITLRNGLGEAL